MASALSAIRTLMVQLAEAVTEAGHCYPGVTDKRSGYPCCEFIFGGSTSKLDMNKYRDHTRRMTINIYGQKIEQIELAAEKLNALYDAPASRLAYQAIGVYDVYPTYEDEDLQPAETGTKGEFMGQLTFNVVHRQETSV